MYCTEQPAPDACGKLFIPCLANTRLQEFDGMTMNANWQEFLGTCGARIAQGQVADFGDIGAELVAARDATIVSPLTHLATLGFTGDDASAFLHNQLTSDVAHLDPDTAQHAAWCTPKGRMAAKPALAGVIEPGLHWSSDQIGAG